MDALLTSADINSYVSGFLWVLTRITTMLLLMPAFGNSSVPGRVKLFWALALAMAIYPQISDLPKVDPISVEILPIIFHQVVIGAVIGFIFRIVFQVFVLGANVIAMQMGLGFATMIDPAGGASVPLISQFYSFLVTLVFLSLDGHLLAIELLVDSFNTLPVSISGIAPGKLWLLIEWTKHLFESAIIISLPAVTSILIVNISFGVMSKAAPSLNIFAIGFPLTLLLGLIIIHITIMKIVPHIEHEIAEAIQMTKFMMIPAAS